MIKKLFVFVVGLTLFVPTFAQIDVVFGTGTASNSSTGYPAPYGNYYEGAKHQILVTASEILAAGAPGNLISALSFDVATANAQPLYNFEIKMGHTTATALSAWQTGLTTVYTASPFTETAGWNTHNFSSNFVWNGSDNIVIEVCFNNEGIVSSYTNNAQMRYTNVGFDAVLYYRSDNSLTVCPSPASQTTSMNRPNMKLSFIPSGNYNIMASQLIAPISDCGLTNNMEVRIFNFGLSDTTNFDITYIVDGGTPVTETVTTNIPANTFIDYTFTTPITYGLVDTHDVVIYTTFAPDTSNEFDTLVTQIINQSTILAPYTDDFDVLADGETGNLSNGWSVTSNSTFSWRAETSTTPTSSTGPLGDHTSGTGTYLFTEATSGVTGDTSYLVSPCMSLQGLSSPLLSFWYHKYGSSMGNLYVDIYADEVWNLKVDSIMGQTQTASSDAWLNNITDLSAFGNKYIKVRFRAVRGSGSLGDMAIDDINVYQPMPFNAGVSSVSAPVTGCGLDSISPVVVDVTNFGYDTITTMYVSFSLDGGMVYTDTLVGTFLPYTTWTHQFQDSVALTSGLHALKVFTTLMFDSIANDDTLNADVNKLVGIKNYPYIQDFESGNDWVSMGTNNSWAFGTPSNTIISSAASGTKAWVTNLTGTHNNNELSYLESPCISFSGVGADPSIKFSHIFETETFGDQGWVEYSTDGGSSWNKLGTGATGTNWYNETFNNWWEGVSDPTWRTAGHELTGMANQSNVKLRFVFESDGSVQEEGFGVDDIVITIPYPNDLEVVKMNAPRSECGMSANEPVEIEIFNNGYDTALSFTVTYVIDGSITVTDTVNSPIPPGDTIVYVFSDSADLSVITAYSFTAYASILDDGWSGNDTLSGLSVGNFVQPPTPVVTNPGSICPGNVATLIETGGVGYIEWYNNYATLQSLDTGSVFVTAPLNANKNYYAQASVGSQLHVGPDAVFGGNSGFSGSGPGLVFNVLNQNGIVIQFVDVNTAGTGTIEVSVWNAANVELVSREFTITSAGMNTIFLNAFVPVGSGYKMRLKSENVGGLQRDKNVSFPFIFPGEVEIVEGTLPQNYYFFYDWTIRNPSCVSPRVTIPVVVSDLPINLGADTLICTSQSIILDAGVGSNYTYEWTTGETSQKLDVVGSDYTTDTVLVIGVTVNDSVENCTGSDEIRLTVSLCTGIDEPDLGIVSIYPNPAKNTLFVNNEGFIGKSYNYQLVNMKGQVLSENTWYRTNGNTTKIDISDIPSGIYVLKIISQGISKTIPVVIE